MSCFCHLVIMSSKYTLNSVGESGQPWRTPLLISTGFDSLLLNFINTFFTFVSSFRKNLSEFFPWDLSVVKISPEWVTGPEQGKRNWIHHVNRMPCNRLPRVMKQYFPTGRRNHGRLLKRHLDVWDRSRSTSGPTAWKIDDDDDDMYVSISYVFFMCVYVCVYVCIYACMYIAWIHLF